MPDLLGVVRTAATLTNRVLVSYSGGKDSVVTLDLCSKHFEQVAAFFMYQVPGLSFQERTLRWAEAKYGIEILRVPHFEVADFLRFGTYHDEDATVRPVAVNELYAYVREQSGTYWIAAGERIADSILRRAMIKHDGTIDDKRGRIYPLAHWTKAHVKAYVARYGLRTAEEAQYLGHSFRDLSAKTLVLVKQHYPEDYERILRMYPLAEAAVKQREFYGGEHNGEPADQLGI